MDFCSLQSCDSVLLCRVMAIKRDSRGSRNLLPLTFTSISSFNTSISSGTIQSLILLFSHVSKYFLLNLFNLLLLQCIIQGFYYTCI